MPTQVVIAASTGNILADSAVQRVVREVRAVTDACVFLCGGAGQMSPADAAAVRLALDALGAVEQRGIRLAVADGGTEAGIMAAAGLARAASRCDFPLIGVVPSREVPPIGTTPLDPHHSHIVKVDNPTWPIDTGFWGSETEAMFALFDALAEGRPAVAVVANGGNLALREVDASIRAGRRIVLLDGTGRATDILAAALRTPDRPLDSSDDLARQVLSLNLLRQPELFLSVPVASGAAGLADALVECLRP